MILSCANKLLLSLLPRWHVHVFCR